MIRRIAGLFLFTLLGCYAPQMLAQADTLKIKQVEAAVIDSIIDAGPKERRPGLALKWALIPGGGQVYNRSWWKVPIVYGALFSAIGYADFNQTNYRRAVNALEAKCFGVDDPENCVEVPHEFSDIPGLDNVDALLNIRDNFDRQRQTAYLIIFFTYLLQGVEAYTDAHLRTFDIDDDLSLQFKPVIMPGNTPGLGLAIPLGAGLSNKKQVAKLRYIVR